jgi:hypothetical protein
MPSLQVRVSLRSLACFPIQYEVSDLQLTALSCCHPLLVSVLTRTPTGHRNAALWTRQVAFEAMYGDLTSVRVHMNTPMNIHTHT